MVEEDRHRTVRWQDGGKEIRDDRGGWIDGRGGQEAAAVVGKARRRVAVRGLGSGERAAAGGY